MTTPESFEAWWKVRWPNHAPDAFNLALRELALDAWNARGPSPKEADPEYHVASPELTAQADAAAKAGRLVFEPGWNKEAKKGSEPLSAVQVRMAGKRVLNPADVERVCGDPRIGVGFPPGEATTPQDDAHRHNLCPICGSPLTCLAGCSAHPNHWYCSSEDECGWEAWNNKTKKERDHE